MPIDTVKKGVNKLKTKDVTPMDDATEDVVISKVSDLEAAERVLAAMHTTPQPIISRMTFSLACTIPTGNYENLTPKIEIEYIVPEGAVPPNP